MHPRTRLLYASTRTLSRHISSTAPLDLVPPIAIAANPIVYHFLPRPLPYARGLLLQETIVVRRLAARKELLSTMIPPGEREKLERIARTDVLLLLEHTPVYTAGRRETDPARAAEEKTRLGGLGADYVGTMRGGQTTYHGPGQLVGYPIIDIGAAKLSTRCYVNALELYLASLVSSFFIPVVTPSPHTGVFTSPNHKIGSIGIHIRHRITLHGFALNVEASVLDWFSHIVACGLDDVVMTSVETELGKSNKGRNVRVEDLVGKSVELFGERFERRMEQLGEGQEHAVLRELIEDGLQGRLPALTAQS